LVKAQSAATPLTVQSVQAADRRRRRRAYSAGSSMPSDKDHPPFACAARNANASAYRGDGYRSVKAFMLGNSVTITV
jgi:hypothetical protein